MTKKDETNTKKEKIESKVEKKEIKKVEKVEEKIEKKVEKNNSQNVQIELNINKKKLIELSIAAISFIFIFLDWAKVSLWGYSYSFNVFHGNMFDLSVMLGLSKVLAIITIIVFVAYIISCFVDLSKYIKNFDFNKYMPLAYYGLYLLTIIFALIGIITTEMVGIALGWFIALIFSVAGLTLTIKPNILKMIIKK